MLIIFIWHNKYLVCSDNKIWSYLGDIHNVWEKDFFIDCFIIFRQLGAVSIRKTVLPGMAIPMLKIRRPNGRLIFNMEITILR